MKNPFLFDLAKSTAAVKKPSGTVQLAYETVFPVVAGQNAAMALVVLKKGGIREPHWHPDAWEFDYCISGNARMSVVGPNNEWREFKVETGQIVFVPQGYFHYFENIGKEDLRFLIVFNNSTRESNDDIGITVSLGGTPNEVLAANLRRAERGLQADPEAAQGGHHHAQAIAKRLPRRLAASQACLLQTTNPSSS
jgi:oxalate decarboxylase